MKQLSSLVWSDGMYLAPHHFQAQSRFFQDLTNFGVSILWFEPYGLAGLELDAEALKNGTVCLVHARGIFPDGLPFHMPENDPLPPARNITDLFPPIRESLMVLLAIPPHRPGGANCALSVDANQAGVRYIAEAYSLPDENTGGEDKAVQLGRKNLHLLLDTEESGDLLTVPIARIKRDASGGFIYDERFIPPCIQISASEALLVMTRRLIEILQEKSGALSAAPQKRGGFQAGYSTQEVNRFWSLHAINANLASLRHIFLSKRGHPEELFMELSRLAGALCTFGMDSHPQSLPAYSHLSLDQCFEALDQHIRTHLELMIPSNYLSIPLQTAGKYIFEGEISDQRCLDRARWIFSIHSPIGEAQVITRTLQLVKICSAQFVPELVKRALPGLTLTHLPVPPSAVASRVESQYFGISRAGPCWDHIVKTRRVGIYVPGDLPQPEIELLVILES
jgi:type VI secretion system protein ImpJ